MFRKLKIFTIKINLKLSLNNLIFNVNGNIKMLNTGIDYVFLYNLILSSWDLIFFVILIHHRLLYKYIIFSNQKQLKLFEWYQVFLKNLNILKIPKINMSSNVENGNLLKLKNITSFYSNLDPSFSKQKRNRNREFTTKWLNMLAVEQHINAEAITKRLWNDTNLLTNLLKHLELNYKQCLSLKNRERD